LKTQAVLAQDEAESEDHEILYDQPLENVEIEDRSQYLQHTFK
jgi:hypothetical protein